MKFKLYVFFITDNLQNNTEKPWLEDPHIFLF